MRDGPVVLGAHQARWEFCITLISHFSTYAGEVKSKSENSSSAPQVTVWFDGGCPLCVREISLMRRLDRRGAIQFVDVDKADGCPLDREVLLARFHAREREGSLVSGAAAFAAMWRAIPLLRPLGLAARWQPLQAVLEKLYVRFLRVRPRLQRLLS